MRSINNQSYIIQSWRCYLCYQSVRRETDSRWIDSLQSTCTGL